MKTRIPALQTHLLVLCIITLVFLQVQSEPSSGLGLRGRAHVARAAGHVDMHARPRGFDYGYGDYGDPYDSRRASHEGASAAINPQGTPTKDRGYDGTTGPNRNSPYALLDELPPRDVPVQSHSTTNRGPSLDPGSVDAKVSAARQAGRAASMKDPQTAALFKGDAAARQAAGLKRLAAAIVAPAAGRFDDKTSVRQKRQQINKQWAETATTSASAGVGAHLGSLFDKAWWAKHNSVFAGSPSFYYPQQDPAAWWSAATWDALDTDLAWSASTKAFEYDYGDNVSYTGDVIYVNGQPACSYEDYVASGQTLANTAAPAADAKWTPLGTFALSQTPNLSKTTMTLQLVVDKEGTISGSYFNLATNDTQILQGGVDEKTQRVAFTIGTNKTTVLETGLANLTEDHAQVWVHFPGGRSQIWLLARLKSK